MTGGVVAVLGGGTGPAAYAFTLGLVAAVNPCGFPLLPAYLAIATRDEDPTGSQWRSVRALWSGLAVTAGFVAVFGVVWMLIEAGLHLATGWVPEVMIPVSVMLTVAGATSAAGRTLKLPVPRFSGRKRSRPLGLIGFGIAYALGSLSCAAPVFLAGIVGTFTRQGPVEGLVSFAAYALGMGLVVTTVSLAGAQARILRLRWLRAAQPTLQRGAGAVLGVVGVYLTYYWTTSLVDPWHTPGPIQAVESVQSGLATTLAGSPRLVGAILGAVVIGTLVVISARRPSVERPLVHSNNDPRVDADRSQPIAACDQPASAERGPSSSPIAGAPQR